MNCRARAVPADSHQVKMLSSAHDRCPLLQGDIDDDTFRQYFEQFGDIDDCVVSSLHLIHTAICCGLNVTDAACQGILQKSSVLLHVVA